MKQYYVYIMASIAKVTYVGFTGNLRKRIWQHKESNIEGFTKRYHVNKLVYYEVYERAITAIEREKQIKKYRREKKIRLIESINSEWRDLYYEL